MDLKSYVLDFRNVPYPHDATAIKAHLKDTIDAFQLEGKLIGITSDNAESNVKAISQLKSTICANSFGFEAVHFRCMRPARTHAKGCKG